MKNTKTQPVRFEGLESRQLYSVSLANGVLTINGTPGNDQTILNQGVSATRAIRVSDNGRAYSFNAASVNRIVWNGGAGNDRLGIGSDIYKPIIADGGSGSDTVEGSISGDTLRGGIGNDTLVGRGGNDRIEGGDNNDAIYGNAGIDTLVGGNGYDSIFSSDGVKDFLYPGSSGENIQKDSYDFVALPATILETPTGLNGIATGTNTASLTWASSSDPQNFIVEQWSISTGWFRAQYTIGTSRSANVTGLDAGTDYQFAIRAIGADGKLSEHSNIIVLSTPAANAPTTPTGLYGAATGRTTVDLTWASASNPQNFIVEQWSITTGWIRAQYTVGTTRSAKVTGLSAGTDYQFAIRAIGANGQLSEHSNIIVVTTGA